MLPIIRYLCLAILAGALIPTAFAQGQSTFTTGEKRDDVLFAVTVPDSSPSPDDLYFYISGPSDSSWIGLGFGEHMKDTLMLVVYTSGKNKSEATVSPRIGHGHSEPIFNPEIVLDKIKSEIRDGRYWVRGMCQNCRRFRDKVYIDFLSTQQPMIYGIGPDQADLSSDDKSAGLRRHDRFGRFTFNMTEAVSGNLDPDSDFPRENEKSNNGSAEVGHQVDDQEYISYAHGLLMIAVFVVLFPLGSVWVRIFEKVRWHWINQAFGTALAFIGAALGVQLSRQYNRSKNYNAPHQILGFTLLGLILIQIGLGATHHRIFQRHQRHTILSLVHRIFGPIVILIGLLNGSLGFRFASTPRHDIGYAILILIVAILYMGATFVHNRRQRRKAAYHTPAARNFQTAYISPEHQFDIPLAQAQSPAGGYPPPSQTLSHPLPPPPYERLGG